MGDLTKILEASQTGEPAAAEQLLPLVYDELRRLAAHKMANEAAGHTLQPTALVHEAWLRLVDKDQPELQKWRGRAHFFGAASEAMRRILIERARRRMADKRGGGKIMVDLDEVDVPATVADDQTLLMIDEALSKLATIEPRKAELVKLRYFVGMSFEEAAAAMDIGISTAKQWWAYCRAWLSVEIKRTNRE
jgi:RNA polymerase sigma factor (TIGR02999 family)